MINHYLLRQQKIVWQFLDFFIVVFNFQLVTRIQDYLWDQIKKDKQAIKYKEVLDSKEIKDAEYEHKLKQHGCARTLILK